MVSKMATTCKSRVFVGTEAVKSLQVIIKMNKTKITKFGEVICTKANHNIEAFII